MERCGDLQVSDDPVRYRGGDEDLLESAETLDFDESRWRNLLVAGIGEDKISGNASTRLAVLGAMGSDERSAT